MTAALLAHQGGWDEVLMVAAPIVLFGVLLAVANRRDGDRRAVDHAEDDPRPGGPDDGPLPPSR